MEYYSAVFCNVGGMAKHAEYISQANTRCSHSDTEAKEIDSIDWNRIEFIRGWERWVGSREGGRL